MQWLKVIMDIFLVFVLRVIFITSYTFFGHRDGAWKGYLVLFTEYY